jgi:hypothetical protein
MIEQKQIDRIYKEANKEIIVRIEKFLRAITRQFIFGKFYKDAKCYWFQIDTFQSLDDERLGKTDYRR